MTDQPPSFENSGFSEPAAGGNPVGGPTSDEKTWGLAAHLGQILVSFIAPLIVMLTKGKESPWLEKESKEALNFSITMIIAVTVSFILIPVIIGALMLIPVTIAFYVLPIIVGIKAYNGESYRYPVNIRFLK